MLKDWIVSYIKSKDANFKNIEKIEEHDKSVVVTNISTTVGSGFKRQSVPKVITYIEKDNLETGHFSPDTVIVTLNTSKNVRFLTEHFDDFAKNETLKIIFANPGINETWQIHPFRHEKVSKMMDANIKQSIMSLFETVPEYFG